MLCVCDDFKPVSFVLSHHFTGDGLALSHYEYGQLRVSICSPEDYDVRLHIPLSFYGDEQYHTIIVDVNVDDFPRYIK